MNWIHESSKNSELRCKIVSKSTSWSLVEVIIATPLSKETKNEGVWEVRAKSLGNNVYIANNHAVNKKANVGGIDQLNWVWLSESSHFS